MEKTRLELVTAAKELNNLFGLDPEIDTGKAISIEELEDSLLKASKLAEPDDEISEKTLEILELLTKRKEGNSSAKKGGNTKKSVPAKKETPPTKKEFPPVSVQQGEEETPPIIQKEKKEKKEKKEPASTNPVKITKKRIIEEMINSQKGATIEQMAQAIVDKKIDPDFKKNCLIVKLWLGKMGFGVKKQDIEKNPIFKK